MDQEEAKTVTPLPRPRLTQQQQGQLAHLQALADLASELRWADREAESASSTLPSSSETPATATTATTTKDATTTPIATTLPNTPADPSAADSFSNVLQRRQGLLQQIQLVSQIRKDLEEQIKVARTPTDTSSRQQAARKALYNSRANVLRLCAITEALQGHYQLPNYDHYIHHFDVRSSAAGPAAAATSREPPRPPPSRKSSSSSISKASSVKKKKETTKVKRNNNRQNELASIVLGRKQAPSTMEKSNKTPGHKNRFYQNTSSKSASAASSREPKSANTTTEDARGKTEKMGTMKEDTKGKDKQKSGKVISNESTSKTKIPLDSKRDEVRTKADNESIGVNQKSEKHISNGTTSSNTNAVKETVSKANDARENETSKESAIAMSEQAGRANDPNDVSRLPEKMQHSSTADTKDGSSDTSLKNESTANNNTEPTDKLDGEGETIKRVSGTVENHETDVESSTEVGLEKALESSSDLPKPRKIEEENDSTKLDEKTTNEKPAEVQLLPSVQPENGLSAAQSKEGLNSPSQENSSLDDSDAKSNIANEPLQNGTKPTASIASSEVSSEPEPKVEAKDATGDSAKGTGDCKETDGEKAPTSSIRQQQNPTDEETSFSFSANGHTKRPLSSPTRFWVEEPPPVRIKREESSGSMT